MAIVPSDILWFRMKTTRKRSPRVDEEELKELLETEKRVLAGKEKLISGEDVMIQIMRGQIKTSKPRRA